MRKYVKIGEVCEKASSSLMQKELKLGSGSYPIYGASGLLGLVDFYKQNKPYIGVVKDGAGVGRVMLLPGYSSCIGTIQYLIPNDNIDTHYLYYALVSLNLSRFNTGATIPHIYFKDYKNENIPYETLEKQREIASILDKITALIGKRQEELHYFDNLVKSQFIEMFGDVIVNEKGWDIYAWEQVLTIKNGRNQSQVENPNGKYAICGSGGIMGYADDFLTEANSVIIGRKGNINKPILMREKFWNVDTAFGIEPKSEMLNVEYLYLYCLFFDFEKLNKAVTIPSLTKGDLIKIRMPLPPMNQQVAFANFVEQTDKSKVQFEMEVAA